MSLRLLVAAAAAAVATAAGLLPTPFRILYTKQCMQWAMPFRIRLLFFFVASSVLFPHSCIGVIIIAIESVLRMNAFFLLVLISTFRPWSGLCLQWFHFFSHSGVFFSLCACVCVKLRFSSILPIKFICIEREMQVFNLSTGCNRLANRWASAAMVNLVRVRHCMRSPRTN